MAQAKTLDGTKLGILLGDGGNPETFTQDCLANTGDRGIEFSSDTNDVIVPDCANPSDPAWKEVMKDGFQAQITGSGVLHTTTSKDWFAWFNSDTAKNCRVELIGVAAADGGGYWEGAFKITSYSVSGSRGDKVQVDFTLVSDGPVTWTDAV